jgi:hypothetical protein
MGRMPTSGPVIQAFTAETLDPPSTVERMMRVLRVVGRAPMGAPGRSKVVGVFEPYHYASLLLGYAGHLPSDAAEAASRLYPFEFHQARMPDGTRPPRGCRVAGNLGEVLEKIIRGEAGPFAPHLLLSLDAAEVQWVGSNGLVDLIEIYGPPHGVKFQPKTWQLRRQVLVRNPMVALAAALWRDTPTNNKDAI